MRVYKFVNYLEKKLIIKFQYYEWMKFQFYSTIFLIHFFEIYTIYNTIKYYINKIYYSIIYFYKCVKNKICIIFIIYMILNFNSNCIYFCC